VSAPGIVAIDGPSASGKSSTARDVAARLGMMHLNSGLLYRAITWAALRDGWLNDPGFDERLAGLQFELIPASPAFRLGLAGEEAGPWLQSPEVNARVSDVAARGAVRARVLELLQAAGRATDLVVDGRDIGTAVFPRATLKIFLPAAAEERARRRLQEHSQATAAAAVAAEASRLRERDRQDSSRIIAPLSRAEDAIELDTTHLARAEVVARIVELYREKRPDA
jgi:cytidylate kinase